MAPFRPRFHRIASRIERTEIQLTVDGQPVSGWSGDTLLTILITHQGALRRAEFSNELRAGFCNMGACQDCWISLTDGRRVRACSTRAESGMAIATDLEHGH
ncbi:MAG: (2Fe-2S)-binding protein [Devosia sp.]